MSFYKVVAEEGVPTGTMDKLDEIFSLQEELDSFIRKSRNLNYTKEEWIQKKSLALFTEVGELLNEINYKWWKNPKETDDKKVKEELADIFHFFVGMCIDAGMTSEELYAVYTGKNKENHNRQTGKSDKKGYEL